MARWNLLHGVSESQARQSIETTSISIELACDDVAEAASSAVRLPAQWEPMESVLVAFPVLYPPLWDLHAQLIESITPVCNLTIIIPAQDWASGIHLYLSERRKTDLARLRYLVLPTDDMWVRDFGPIVGLDSDGDQSVVHPIFETLPHYPQKRDGTMAERWAAYEEIPSAKLDLHLEGGNLWSDGEGTLITSEHVFAQNRLMSRKDIERRLRQVFHIEKLIILPRMMVEETGHIDLLVKLANRRTALMTRPHHSVNGRRLRKASKMLQAHTNAHGEPYEIHELPAPPVYLNWGVYPIWRSYTNALTVNGRVLVPVYGIHEDAEALATYARAMPGYKIIGIDCSTVINGGGAVHCLTKEIPASRKRM